MRFKGFDFSLGIKPLTFFLPRPSLCGLLPGRRVKDPASAGIAFLFIPLLVIMGVAAAHKTIKK